MRIMKSFMQRLDRDYVGVMLELRLAYVGIMLGIYIYMVIKGLCED